MKRKALKALLVPCALAAILLAACGDDSSSASPEENASVESSSGDAFAIVSSESNEPGDILSSSTEDIEISSSSVQEPVEGLVSGSDEAPSGEEPESSSSVESSSAEQDLSSATNSSSSKVYLDPATVVRDSMIDSRDGQVYKIVTVGNQTWMAQNLNYAYLGKTSSLDSSSYCLYNEPDSCASKGRLYIWSAAMDSAGLFSDDCLGCGYGDLRRNIEAKEDKFYRGVCPEGWHLSTHTEWWEMFYATGVTEDERGAMALDPVAWGKTAENIGAYGLDFIPTGLKGWNGRWELNDYFSYWTSTESSDRGAYTMAHLEWGADFCGLGGYGNNNKEYASAVRCIKNYELSE